MPIFWNLLAFIAALVLMQAAALAEPSKVYRVGLVSVGESDAGVLSADTAHNFARRGYVEGTNIVFERRAAQGSRTAFAGLSTS